MINKLMEYLSKRWVLEIEYFFNNLLVVILFVLLIVLVGLVVHLLNRKGKM